MVVVVVCDVAVCVGVADGVVGVGIGVLAVVAQPHLS